MTTGFLSEKLEPVPGVKPKLDPRRSVPSLGTRSAARDFRIPGARKMTRRRERLMRFFVERSTVDQSRRTDSRETVIRGSTRFGFSRARPFGGRGVLNSFIPLSRVEESDSAAIPLLNSSGYHRRAAASRGVTSRRTLARPVSSPLGPSPLRPAPRSQGHAPWPSTAARPRSSSSPWRW